jgi:hypothetical protein
MTVRWIRLHETESTPGGGFFRRWRDLIGGGGRPRSERERRVASACFGRLSARQERIVESVAAEAPCSTGERLDQ